MRNVLIIDDEEKLRTLLARIIGLEGFTVFLFFRSICPHFGKELLNIALTTLYRKLEDYKIS